MTNTFMLAGNDDPGEQLERVKDGIYAKSFGGGQVDITSGKFVFSCTEAYRIRGGRIAEPVKGATLFGDGPTMLTRVKGIGNDLVRRPEPAPGPAGRHQSRGGGRQARPWWPWRLLFRTERLVPARAGDRRLFRHRACRSGPVDAAGRCGHSADPHDFARRVGRRTSAGRRRLWRSGVHWRARLRFGCAAGDAPRTLPTRPIGRRMAAADRDRG